MGDELFVKNRGLLLLQNGRLVEARTWITRALAATPDDATLQHARTVLADPSAAER